MSWEISKKQFTEGLRNSIKLLKRTNQKIEDMREEMKKQEDYESMNLPTDFAENVEKLMLFEKKPSSGEGTELKRKPSSGGGPTLK